MTTTQELREIRDRIARAVTFTESPCAERDELFIVYCALTKAIHHLEAYNSIVWSNYND